MLRGAPPRASAVHATLRIVWHIVHELQLRHRLGRGSQVLALALAAALAFEPTPARAHIGTSVRLACARAGPCSRPAKLRTGYRDLSTQLPWRPRRSPTTSRSGRRSASTRFVVRPRILCPVKALIDPRLALLNPCHLSPSRFPRILIPSHEPQTRVIAAVIEHLKPHLRQCFSHLRRTFPSGAPEGLIAHLVATVSSLASVERAANSSTRSAQPSEPQDVRAVIVAWIKVRSPARDNAQPTASGTLTRGCTSTNE